MSLLDQIDRLTSGLCPCGTPSAEGSAYCSDDCRPTHISDDTDTRMFGDLATPMRWRPDLVTEIDDSDLINLGTETFGYRGRFHAQLFERRSNPEVWHLRLDDGHRFVGCDLDGVGNRRLPITDELAGRVRDAWRRLERELVNPRHTELVDADPWATELDRRQAAVDQFALQVRRHRLAQPPRELSEEAREQIRAYLTEGARQATRAMSALIDAMRPAMTTLIDAFAAARLIEPLPPEDPMERALHARRNRNTGPPPNRLDGRRRRR